MTPSAHIQQGDQYTLPLVLLQGTTLIDSSDVVALRAIVGGYSAYYPNSTLTYDAQNGQWLFPLTQEMTYAMSGDVEVQAQATFTDGTQTVCIGTAPIKIKVKHSPLEGAWID